MKMKHGYIYDIRYENKHQGLYFDATCARNEKNHFSGYYSMNILANRCSRHTANTATIPKTDREGIFITTLGKVEDFPELFL